MRGHDPGVHAVRRPGPAAGDGQGVRLLEGTPGLGQVALLEVQAGQAEPAAHLGRQTRPAAWASAIVASSARRRALRVAGPPLEVGPGHGGVGDHVGQAELAGRARWPVSSQRMASSLR